MSPHSLTVALMHEAKRGPDNVLAQDPNGARYATKGSSDSVAKHLHVGPPQRSRSDRVTSHRQRMMVVQPSMMLTLPLGVPLTVPQLWSQRMMCVGLAGSS